MTDNNSLRQSFDDVALQYNEVRPRYPDKLFSTLINITGLPRDAKLLEIGPGTGQATKSLAKKGFDIMAVELGRVMADVAKSELQDYKKVQVINDAFEEIKLPPASFDLVFAATSFHWIDPLSRYVKTHELLKTNGHLAIIHTNHISDESGDVFFNVSKPIYDRHDFADKHRIPELPKSKDLKPEELDESLFKLIHFRLFPVTITYSARNFVQLLGTYSNHLAGSKEVQQAFYNEIENLINDKFQSEIAKHYSISLTIARKY